MHKVGGGVRVSLSHLEELLRSLDGDEEGVGTSVRPAMVAGKSLREYKGM